MALPKYENIVADGSYLIDSETGEKVVFYECDPQKNCECADKGMCAPLSAEESRGMGGCSKTVNPAFCKDGGRCWYAVLKTPDDGEPYWGREYIEEA